MKQYFKVLNKSGRSCHGGDFRWSLPAQDSDGNWTPGEWHEHDGYVLLCVSGFHLTDSPAYWSDNNNTVTYECEIADDAITSEHDDYGNKIAVSKVRLIKLFTGSIYDIGVCKEQHFVDGKLHRDNDMPAVVRVDNGYQCWYRNGKLHRDNDKPAVVRVDKGYQCWYRNGKLHRDNDLPAMIYPNGDQYWYRNGKIHRDNDMPAVVLANTRKEWYRNGKLHRDNDLPAMVWADGYQCWYRNGKLYRDSDMPVMSYPDTKYKSK